MKVDKVIGNKYTPTNNVHIYDFKKDKDITLLYLFKLLLLGELIRGSRVDIVLNSAELADMFSRAYKLSMSPAIMRKMFSFFKIKAYGSKGYLVKQLLKDIQVVTTNFRADVRKLIK